ncbi:MAG: lipid A biosynthesis acyltransferase [Chitinophagaceae bacterium]
MYQIIYGVLFIFSLLPFGVLYKIADFLYFLIYKVAKYRVQIVKTNMQQAFPDYSEKEIKKIMTAYYHNLCDSIVETIKLMTITQADLDKRITVNWDIFDEMSKQNRNGQGFLSHQFNWEWGTVVCNWHSPRRFNGLYMPISNKAIDKLFLKIRSRSGTRLIPVQDMQKRTQEIQSKETLWGFIADQNPSSARRASWHLFMNKETAFFKAPELLARRYNNIVYFGEIIKLKRGYYEIKLKLAFDNPQSTKDGEITETYVRFLEDSIKRQPENWVWSHRRWKHSYPFENKEN